MDKTKKVLSIILITLLIVSTVFTLCKKVGLCASGGGSGVINSFPLPVGDGYGHDFTFGSSDVDIINNYNASFDNSFPYVTDVFFYDLEVSSNILYIACLYNPVYTSLSSSGDFLSLSGDNCSIYSGGSYVGYLFISYDLDSRSVVSHSWRNQYYTLSSLSWFESVSGGFSLKLNENLYTYPIYISSDNQYFANSSPIFSGHSKGGVLTNYIDSADLIEQDSSLPSVDTSAPSDSSSIPSWLQKILSGIAKVNQSIKGGVLTIGDYIGQFKQELLDKLNEIFSLDSDAVNDAWDSSWENSEPHALVTHFQTMHSALLSIVNVSPADTLVFTIDMYPITIPNLNGGSSVIYLFGRSVTLDFSWYKSALFGGRSIQDIVLSVVLPFLYVGFIMSLFFKAPAIISGASGFASNVKEVSNKSSGWAPTSHGIFTSGVSRSSPSLDKSPLSGGGSSGVTSFWY